MPKPVVIECWVQRDRASEDPEAPIHGRIWAIAPTFDDRDVQIFPYEIVYDRPTQILEPIIRPVSPNCRHRARITVEFLEDEEC